MSMTSTAQGLTPGDVRTFLRSLFTFECVFLLFLFAGRIKGDARLQWIPFDLTAAMFGVSVIVGGLALYRSRMKLPVPGLQLALLTFLFIAWTAVSLLWSPSVHYGREKVLHTATLLFWPVIGAGLVMAPDTDRIRRFTMLLAGFATLMTLDILFLAAKVGPGMVMFTVGTEYLGVGRVVGLAAPVMLWMAATTDRASVGRAGLIAFGASMAVLLIAGGRGPLLASLGAMATPMAAFLLPGRRGAGLRRYRRYLLVTVAVGTLVAGVMTVRGGGLNTVERTMELFTEDSGGYSAGERSRYYAAAVEHWQESPLYGHGIGSFPLLIDRGDTRLYPHNIVLEALVELGIIGLVLMVLPFVAGVTMLFRGGVFEDPVTVMIVMMLANTLLNAQVTADIPDNRLLFMMIGLMASGRARRVSA